jgi:hypothetical protein
MQLQPQGKFARIGYNTQNADSDGHKLFN